MKEYKKIIPLICCLLLMLVKVSALHVFAHQSSDENTIENCSFCELAIENQKNELVNPSEIEFTSDETIFVIIESEVKYQNSFVESFSAFHLFSRPPPKA